MSDTEIYYDPFDYEVDMDPHPVWKRMREEMPLYYNEKYDFYAVSRYEDVEACSKDWRRYSSAKGTILELIRSGMTPPPGIFIFTMSEMGVGFPFVHFTWSGRTASAWWKMVALWYSLFPVFRL